MKKVLLAAMLAPALLSAETWDLAKDFSTDKNPNGPWQYGYSTFGGTTLTPLPAAKDILAVSGLNGWAVNVGTFPFVAKNTTAAPVGASGFVVPAGEVVVHPGFVAPADGRAGSADVVYVRWVAPTDGIYQVNAVLRRLDPATSTSGFVIKQLGKPDQEVLLAGREVPPEAGVAFSEPLLSMAAKDTLDFAVWAGQGTENDATGLAVRIAPADPELAKPRALIDYPLEADAKDCSGQSREGTVQGNPVFAVVDGRNALVFDGAGDWVDTGTALPELRKEFTIEGWVRPDARQASDADIFGNHGAGTGMVLQQEGGNTNRYAFAMGSGSGGWTSTKPIQLAAGRWQHVAVVKSAKDLKFYLNGVLLDTVPAAHAVIPGPMNFRIGLGFEAEARSFRGALSGLKIWNRAQADIKPQVTTEQRFEALANNTSVRLEARDPSRIFSAANPPAIKVSFDVVDGPAIGATFDCLDDAGKSFPMPGLELNAKNQFSSTFKPALPAGLYRLTCRPTVTGPSGARDLSPVTLTFAVKGDSADPLSAGTPVEASEIGSQATLVTSLDGEAWKIAIDPKNVGREEKWFNAPTADAKPTKVPWIIQDIFPNYHGIAWYWREFSAPKNPHDGGRFILRFLAVDYLAEVWVNGVKVGQHEGSEDPFELDVTDAIKPGANNQLAVRVLNPTNEPIDGIVLNTTARSARNYPLAPCYLYNVGGIVDSIELLAVPSVRVENLYVKPDWKTGRVRVEAKLRNASGRAAKVTARFTISPAIGGEGLDAAAYQREIPPGDTRIEAEVTAPDFRLWSPEDPFLYRVSAQVAATGSPSFDEKTTRCGFRDFRFENDAFRLNGKRIYLQGALILPHYPVGHRVSPHEDFMRRDLVAAKAMGLNIIRVIWGGLRARDLDLFDEMGIMVQQEHFGGVWMAPSPDLERRFDASVSGMIRRDRNHPSIAIWCLLNEIMDGPQFRHAEQSLPMVKSLDDTRLVQLNSGGFDMQMQIGSISNPGATTWQHLMGSERPDGPALAWTGDYFHMLDNKRDIKADIHPYQPVPHTAVEIRRMRTLGERATGRKIVISEIGDGCAVNLPRFARHYEQMGAESAEDARYYRDKLDLFLADWKKWDLGRIWTSPEDYFTDSERNMVKLRMETGNALRANPHLAGYTFCALPDSDLNGVGLLNNFREFKPGVVELQNDLTAPVRWCLFAEPVNIYSGGKLKLEAILSNLDALPAGDYPVRIEVVAPDGRRVFEEKLNLTIPAGTTEQPLVKEVFSREVPVSGPAGTYKFLVRFERGAVATGGEITFNVFDPAAMPPVGQEVVLWGNDPGLAQSLTNQKIRFRPYAGQPPSQRELILVGNGSGDLAAFRELAQRMARGSTVVFLSPAVFARGGQPLAFLPLATKGALGETGGGYYRGDTFAAKHPVFDGLPSGGILDYTFYRNIITQGGIGLAGADAPEELIVGGIRAQAGYASVVQTAAYNFGAGRFLFNTLKIRENLGTDPVAELLLRNLLNYSARDLDKPPADLPADFQQQLKAIGYE
jgi:hypothetical protein